MTANDKGLHVRIREIEAANKKQSLVFLTREPGEVCRFFGLDEKRMGIDEEGVVRGGDGMGGVGFGSMEDMYEFVVGSRMFRRDSYIRYTVSAMAICIPAVTESGKLISNSRIAEGQRSKENEAARRLQHLRR